MSKHWSAKLRNETEEEIFNDIDKFVKNIKEDLENPNSKISKHVREEVKNNNFHFDYNQPILSSLIPSQAKLWKSACFYHGYTNSEFAKSIPDIQILIDCSGKRKSLYIVTKE